MAKLRRKAMRTVRQERVLFLALVFIVMLGAALPSTHAQQVSNPRSAWQSSPPSDACIRWAESSVGVSGRFVRQGKAYVVGLPDTRALGDTSEEPQRSPFLLCEDGKLIGHPHSSHDSIRTNGGGLFSHWYDTLYFSAPDDSNPNTNGRSYALVRPADREVVSNAVTAPSEQPSTNSGTTVHTGSDPHAPASVQWASNACADPAKAAEDHAMADHRAEAVHGADKIKAAEHAAFLQLVPDCAVTHVAVRSGAWSDPGVWRDGTAPGASARVLIPAGMSVQFDGQDAATVADWIRIDGLLSFRADQDTALALRTLVVTEQGRLEIGTRTAPVRADVKARLLFAPRAGRDRQADPFDLAGGLISHGTVEMVAERKTPHVSVTAPLVPATDRLLLPEPAMGWRIGDQLLVPGTEPWTDQDELRTVTAIGDGGTVIALDRPLGFTHAAPAGIGIWIGNLSRAIEVSSMRSKPIEARGHVMFMHAQTGTLIDGAAFLSLGRTDTRTGHTIPELGPDGLVRPGTDANTIGRYAVHFHVRSGAHREIPPHVIRNSVVVDSPKFGIVNHGAHLLAEDNVTFRVAGTHLIAENGAEIGVFRRNMAVRSEGSGDPSILSRMGIYDNAHDGNGIWLTSGGVEVTDNWASGHSDGAFKMLAMDFYDQGEKVFFDGSNIGNPKYADPSGRVSLSDVNLYLARNYFAASKHGIQIWNHKDHPAHDELSVIEDTHVWNMQSNAVFIPYTRNIVLRNLNLVGSGGRATVGIDGNHHTANVAIEGGKVQRFAVGIRLPPQGRNVVRHTILANDVDLQVPPPVLPGRQVLLEHLSFLYAERPRRARILLEPLALPFNGDGAVLFGEDQISMTSRSGQQRRLFFAEQKPGAVLFTTNGPEPLRGRSNAELQRRFGLTVGGSLAPAGARVLPGSNALWSDAKPMPSGSEQAAPDADFRERYEAVAKLSPTKRIFMVHPSLVPLQIHPDDIGYGYRVLIYIVERKAGVIAIASHFENFPNLTADPDGVVRVRSRIAALGTESDAPVELAIRVTPDAIRRGPNVDYFLQREYCGSCGMDGIDENARRLIESRD